MPTDTRTSTAGTTTPTPNTEILRRGYDAFQRGDMSEVFRMFAPDVEWTTPEGMNDFGIGGVHKGHEEVAAFFGRLPGVFGELRVEPQQFVEQGDHIVVLGPTMSARRPASPPTTGSRMRGRCPTAWPPGSRSSSTPRWFTACWRTADPTTDND